MGLLPFSIVLPVLVSIFAKSITKRASAFYRGMIFVPMILAPVAAAAVFRWILHPAGGLPVSYTHLDVYKRQVEKLSCTA